MKLLPLILTFIITGCVCTYGASGRLDGRTRHILSTTPPSRSEATMGAFVRVAPGATDLPDDIEITRRIGDILLVRGTAAQLQAAAGHPSVLSVSVESPLVADNDIAGEAVGARAVAKGLEGTRPFTGRGVLAGLFDNGFDFANPSFRTADGTNRIERVYNFTADDGTFNEYAGAVAIDNLISENPDDCHGTHVLGSIAGLHHGTVTIALPGGGTTDADASIYAGMATDAAIAVGCGTLSDANIAEGVARIVDYARSTGRPCVVNLSLSDILGPHDGSDAFAATMSELGKEAIIVASAGNYAGHGKSISHIFSESAPSVGSFLWPIWWKDDADGAVTLWSGDERPLELQLQIWENAADKLLTTIDIPLDEEGTVIVTTDYAEGPGRPVGKPDEAFSTGYTDSFIAIYPDRSPSGRHGYFVVFDLKIRPDGIKPRFIAPGIVAKGSPGQRADIYISSTYGELHGLGQEGFSDGRDDMSVSSMACGDAIVCVGAWTSRPQWPALDGRTIIIAENGYTEGEIAPFSSFGVLVDGRSLPHVAAPGAGVVSPFSTPYRQRHTDNDFYGVVAQSESFGRTDYWTGMYGTSMSAPVTAGCIAQWLEADPDLTAKDVIEILRESSTVDDAVRKDPVRWGAGKLDAAAGLRRVLERRGAIAGPSAVPQGEPQVSVGADAVEVFIAGAHGFEAALYDLAGNLLARSSTASDTLSLPLGAIAKGIYVLRAGAHGCKIAVGACR